MSRRTIVVGERTWKYNVGRQFVVAKSDEDVRKTVTIAELHGTTDDEIQRARHKGCAYAVTPKLLVDWLSA